MNRAEALYSFWSSFGWVAIDEESSYDDGIMEELDIPDWHITFENAVGEIDEKIALTASLWDRNTSWARIEAKAAEIYDFIGLGGCKVGFEGGQLWITRRSPFQKRGATPDYNQRRIILSINAEYLTA